MRRIFGMTNGTEAGRATGDEATREYYARRAPEYESIYARPERQGDLAWLRGELPAWFAGRDVLEVACGTGFWTEAVAPAARSMVALDSAEEVLAIARTKAGCAGVRFVLGDAWAPAAAAPGPFDAAFAAFWWSHVPLRRAEALFAGWSAALRPGARVVLIDNRYVEGSSTPLVGGPATGGPATSGTATGGAGGVDTFQDRLLADGSVHRILKNFPTEADFVATLGTALPGATELVWRQSTYFWLAAFRMPG